MKAMVVGFEFDLRRAAVKVAIKGSYITLPLPTDEVLTEERVKEVIITGLKAMRVMWERMAVLDAMLYQEVDIDKL